MRTHSLRARTAAALFLALTLAGCSGGGAGGGTSGGSGSGSGDTTAGGGGAERAAPQSRTDVAGAPARRADAPSRARGQPSLAPRNRAIIHTASLTVGVDDVTRGINEAERVVREADGFVYAEHITTDSDEQHGTTATLTLKVPPGDFQKVLDRLASDLGTLRERKQDAKDVTEKVADVQSRVDSAEATIERLRTLLDRANNVDDVLKVEEKLAGRQADLESLQARADALEEKTRYGTVTLRLREQAPPRAAGPDGFLAGLFAGWGAFTTTMGGLATAAGASLPFLVPLAILATVVLWIHRRVSRRRVATIGTGEG